MPLFSGSIMATTGGPEDGVIRLVKGCIGYTETASNSIEGCTVYPVKDRQWEGIFICDSFPHSGFFRFSLVTDIGYAGSIRIRRVEAKGDGSVFVAEFINDRPPVSLPPDGSLGVSP